MVNTRMDELEWLRNQLKMEGNDLLREMVRSFAQGRPYTYHSQVL